MEFSFCSCATTFRFSAASMFELNDESRLRNKALTIKCLQLLRAIIYNEIVKLPEDWNFNDGQHQTLVKVHVQFSNVLYTVLHKIVRVYSIHATLAIVLIIFKNNFCYHFNRELKQSQSAELRQGEFVPDWFGSAIHIRYLHSDDRDNLLGLP